MKECTWSPSGCGIKCHKLNEVEEANKSGSTAMHNICLKSCYLSKPREERPWHK